MKINLCITVVASLLTLDTIEGVPISHRKNTRKQVAPSRAPLSDVTANGPQSNVATLPRSSLTVERSTKPTFKPSFNRLSIDLPTIGSVVRAQNSQARISRPREGKGKGKAQLNDDTVEELSSSGSVESSWQPEEGSIASTSSLSTDAAIRGARYQHETREEGNARRKAQAALFQAKWKAMNLSHEKVDPKEMAFSIQSIDIGDMTRTAISRKAIENLKMDGVGEDYLEELRLNLSKKNNLASLYRFRERVKPVAQRRRYNWKSPRERQQYGDHQ
jgi:hypothetical protein